MKDIIFLVQDLEKHQKCYIYKKHFLEFKGRIGKVVGYEKIQFVTISRISVNDEHEPYNFVDTEEFEYEVGHM